MDRSTLFSRLRLVAVGLALLAPRPAAALEKVINGRFDYGLSNWPQIVIGGDVSWDGTLDADGSALSGSLRFENDSPPSNPNSSTSLVVVRCYPASPGDAFFAGATMRFSDDEPSKGTAKVLLVSFPTSDCTGPGNGIAGSTELVAGYGTVGRGVWTRLPLSNPGPEFVVPAGGKSILLELFLGLAGGTGISVNIDDGYLAPVGTPVCDGLPATKLGTVKGGPGTDTCSGGLGFDAAKKCESITQVP